MDLEPASISLTSALTGKERSVCALDVPRVSLPSKESEFYDLYGHRGPYSIWSVGWSQFGESGPIRSHSEVGFRQDWVHSGQCGLTSCSLLQGLN